MISEDMILKLDDNKEYYVMSSIVNDNNNYIVIGEMDRIKEEITDNIKIMYYDNVKNVLRKVTDPQSIFQLCQLFADNYNPEN